MVIDDEIPLLRTFRAELAKRSSMLFDEDMEEFFQQLNEFEGYGNLPTTYFGGHHTYVSQAVIQPAATVSAQLESQERLLRVSKVGTVQEVVGPQRSRTNLDSMSVSVSQDHQRRLYEKVAVMTSSNARATSADVQTLITVRNTEVAPRGPLLHVSAILNPSTRERVNIVEAIQSGLIDPKTQTYCEPKSKQRLSLHNAAKQGFIDESLLKQLNSNSGIKDRTGKSLTLMEAIGKDLYDPVTNSVKDPAFGTEMPLSVAVSRNIMSESCAASLQGEPVNITAITHAQAVVPNSDLAKADASVSLTQAIEQGLFDQSTGKIHDPFTGEKLTLINAVEKGIVNSSVCEILSPQTGQCMTLTEAVSKGIVDPVSGTYVHATTNQRLPLDEAHTRGLVRRPAPLSDVISDGCLLENGSILDKTSGQVVTLEEALRSGLVDGESKCLVDPKSGDVLSLSEAMRRGLVNKAGDFVPFGRGSPKSILNAVGQGDLKLVNESVTFSDSLVKDTSTKQGVTLSEAIKQGLMTSKGTFIDKRTRQELSPQQAVARGIVDQSLVDKLNQKTRLKDRTGQTLTMLQGVQMGYISPEDGSVKDPRTGKLRTCQQAATEGILSPDEASDLLSLISPVVTSTTILTQIQPSHPEAVIRSLSVTEATRRGLLDDGTGMYTHPQTGEKMPVDEALSRGYLRLSSEWPSTPDGTLPKGFDELDERNGATFKVSVGTQPRDTEPSESVESFMSKSGAQYSFTTTTTSLPSITPTVINETRQLTLKSVVDPRTGRDISVTDAMNRGLIDLEKGLYCDSTSGTKMPLNIAVERGYIKADQMSDPSSQNGEPIKETRAFSITGVIHPKTGEKMTVSQAIRNGILDQENGLYHGADKFGRKETMPISEAIQKGFVIAEDISTTVSVPGSLLRETKTFNLKSVKHPLTGKYMTVADAVSQGIIDESEGVYINPFTGVKMSIHEAIEKKLIEAELTSVTSNAEGDVNKITTTKLTTLAVTAVKDPRTGRLVTVNKAIEDGILDHGKGIYHNLVTGESMPLNEAIDSGLVMADTAEDDDDLERAEIASIHIADDQESFEATLLEDIHSETMTLSISSVIDPRTMEMISYDDAVLNDILMVNDGIYRNPLTGEKMTITVAMEKGLIHGEVTAKTKEEEIMRCSVNAEKPTFTSSHQITSAIDPRTGKQISVARAVKEGLINVEKGTFHDTRCGEEISLENAMNQGFLNPSKQTGASELEKSMDEDDDIPKIVLRRSSDKDSPWSVVDIELEKTTAEEPGESTLAREVLHYSTEIESHSPLNRSTDFPHTPLTPGEVFTQESGRQPLGLSYEAAVKLGIVDTERGRVKDPKTGVTMTLSDAVTCGLIDADKTAISDPTSGRTISLSDCLTKGIVNPVSCKVDPMVAEQSGVKQAEQLFKGKQLNLIDTVRNGLFDNRSGKIFEPTIGKSITLREGLNKNYIEGTLVTVKNTQTGERVPLKRAMQQGLIDGTLCLVWDKATNKKIPLPVAIERDLVENVLDCSSGQLLDSQSGKQIPLEKALAQGKLKPESVEVLDTRTGEHVQYQDALRRGLIDRSGNVVDKSDGSSMSAEDALKMGLLAIVGGPILAGKMVVDAVKKKTSERSSRPSGFTEGQLNGEPNNRESSRTVETRETEPLTTIVYAKPGDNIRPAKPTSSREVQEVVIETSVIQKVRKPSDMWEDGKIETKLHEVGKVTDELDSSETSTDRFSSVSGVVGVAPVDSASSLFSAPSPSSPTKSSVRISQQSEVKGVPMQPSPSSISAPQIYTPSISSSETKPSVPSVSDSDLDIDWNSGQVLVKSTGVAMTVTQAVQKGYIDSEVVERLAVNSGFESGHKITINWDDGSITEKNSGKTYTIHQALDKGLIDRPTFNALTAVTGDQTQTTSGYTQGVQFSETFKSTTVQKSSYREGTAGDKITSSVRHSEKVESVAGSRVTDTKPLRPSNEVPTLNQLVKEEQYIPSTGKVIDPKTRRSMTISEAVGKGLVDSENSVVIDPKSGHAVPLVDAIDRGILDPRTGYLIHADTDEKITLQEADLEGLIPHPEHLNTLRINGKAMSLKDAVAKGLVDMESGTFTDPLTSDIMSLAAAISYGYVASGEAQTATSGKSVTFNVSEKLNEIRTTKEHVERRSRDREIIDPSKRISFAEALDLGFIDLETQKYTDPNTGSRMAIIDALREQILDPSATLEPAQSEGMSPLTAVERGLYDKSKGGFKDPASPKKSLTFQEAVKTGFLSSKFSIYDVKSGEVYTLEEGISEGKLDATSGEVYDPDTKRSIPLKEAAKMGLIAVVGAPVAAAFMAKEKIGSVFGSRKGAAPVQEGPKESEGPLITFQTVTVKQLSPKVIEVTQMEQGTELGKGKADVLTLMEAVSTGYLNTKTGVLKDPNTSRQITLFEAVRQGVVRGDSAILNYKGSKIPLERALLDRILDHTGHMEVKGSPKNLEQLIKDGIIQEVSVNPIEHSKLLAKTVEKVSVDSVYDSRTNQQISLDEAIDKRIIHLEDGTYVDPSTGTAMDISDAVRKGLVQGTLIDSVRTKEHTTRAGFAAEVAFSEKKTLKVQSVRDPESGRNIPLAEAIAKGIIDKEGKTYFEKSAQKHIPIETAMEQQLVTASEIKAEMKTGEKYTRSSENIVTQTKTFNIQGVLDPATNIQMTVAEAIQNGVLDTSAGVVINKRTGESMLIADALKQGLLKGTTSGQGAHDVSVVKRRDQQQSVYDAESGHYLSWKEAVRQDIIDPSTGMYKISDSEAMSVEQGVREGLIRKGPAQSTLKKRKSFDVTAVYDSRKGKEVPVVEAIDTGLINLQTGMYNDPAFSSSISIQDAFQKGLISSSTREVRPDTTFAKSLAVLDSADGETITTPVIVEKRDIPVRERATAEYIDSSTGKAVHGAKRFQISGDEQEGQVLTSVVQKSLTIHSLVDPATGREISLAEAVEEEIFDPDKGELINKNTGQHISVDEAMGKGMVSADVVQGQKAQEFTLVKGLIITSVTDARTGKEMSIRDAMKNGILDEKAGTYYNTATKKKVPVKTALKQGMIEGKDVEKSEQQKQDSKQINVTSVMDSKTGEELRLEDAMYKGIIDEHCTMYTDTLTGKKLSVEEAMKEGLVAGSIQTISQTQTTVMSKKSSSKYNIVGVIDTRNGAEISVGDAVNKGILDPTGTFVDTRTGSVMSVADAIKKGLVITEEVGDEKGAADVSITVKRRGEKFVDAMRNGSVDPNTGLYRDNEASKTYSVDEGIRSGKLLGDDGRPYRFKVEPSKGIRFTFQNALKLRFINTTTGLFHHELSGQEMTIQAALDKGFLSPVSTVVGNRGESVVMLKSGVAPVISAEGMKELIDTQTGQKMTVSEAQVKGMISHLSPTEKPSLDEAFTAGSVDSTGLYHDPLTGETMTVDEAVMCGFLNLQPNVQPNGNEDIVDRKPQHKKEILSLTNAVKFEMVDPLTGIFTDSDSGKSMPVGQAVLEGYLAPTMSSSKDHDKHKPPQDKYITMTEGSPFKPKQDIVVENGQVVSTTATEVTVTSGSATYTARPGFTIDSSGNVVNTKTGEKMSLSEAEHAGIVDIEESQGVGAVQVTSPAPPVIEVSSPASSVTTSSATTPTTPVVSFQHVFTHFHFIAHLYCRLVLL